MSDTSNLVAIGRFSTLTRISVRMLRHYDAHGVLVPAVVDTATGYRWYAPGQVADAVLVRQLRDVGFGVPAIGALVAARDTSTFAHALDQQRAVLVDESRSVRHRLDLIDQMRATHQKESTMSVTIDLHPFAARSVVGLRGTIPTYADEGLLWERFMPEVARQGIAWRGPCGATNHDDGFVEQDVDSEVWAPVDPATTAALPLVRRDLPEERAARAVLTGPYVNLGEACDQLVRWTMAQGLTPTGGMRYVYLNDPQTTSPDQLVTEVYLPVAEG